MFCCFTKTYYYPFAGSGELLNSRHSCERTENILKIESTLQSYKYLLTPNNLLQSDLWREQGMLYIKLLFVRQSLSCIFPEGTDLLIPLSDAKRHLAETLLQQLAKMVSTEEALEVCGRKDQKEKKDQAFLYFGCLSSVRPTGRGEKIKESESGSRPTKESQRWRKEIQTVEGDEVMFVRFPPNPFIHLDPEAFIQVFPQLVCLRIILVIF